MSDPSPKPKHRSEKARALALKRAAQAERGEMPAKPAPKPKPKAEAAKPAATGRNGKPKTSKRKTPRGLVCPKCGKYHDVSDRPPGDAFDCYCGEELVVPEETERRDPSQTAAAREERERARRVRLAGIAGFAAFVIGAGLIAAGVYVAVVLDSMANAACSVVIGLCFLAAAAFANAERRSILREDEDDE